MRNRPTSTFLLLTVLFSSIFYFLIIRSGHMGGGWGAYVAGVTLHSNPGIALPCFQLFPGFKYMGFLHRKSGTLYSKAGRSSGQSSSGF